MPLDQSLILCSTPRLARSLQVHHQEKQISEGFSQWQAPAISTLSEWLNTVIESAVLMGEIDADQAPLTTLSATQEGLLWEQSIQHCLKAHTSVALFDTAGLASAAMEANRLVSEWQLSMPVDTITEETKQFLQWRVKFQALCKQANVLESVRYEDWQITCIERDAGQLPPGIQLAGFDRIHPHTKRLIEALKKRGVAVSTHPLSLAMPQTQSHVLLNDRDEECRAVVAWAKAQLLGQPESKIAIVVPELENLRDKLANLLDDTFHPQTAAPAFAEQQRCYDFTLGVPLSSLPMISTALALLRFAWQQQPIMQADIATLLQSAYWSASQKEADARAQLDARMRQQLPLSIKNHRFLRFVQHACESEQPLALSHLLEDTNQLLGIAQTNRRQQSAAIWADVFKSILKTCNWPGERHLSSHEYQGVQAFNRVLQQLSSLESLVGNMSVNEAIKRLTQLCKAQIFQPERKTQAAIQVMGMLEAAAAPLDAIWIMGMNDHVWPPIARHNALLPADSQRQAGTPNASSEVQATFANAIHQRLIRSAKQVIFSSADKDGDRQLRISPLMVGISALIDTPMPVTTLAESLAQNSQHDWQWLDDYQAPPVQAGEHISGGTGLLKAQATCPAWAFYQYRLYARKLGEPVNGLDVMERGTLVHAVLAAYWQGRNSNDLQDSIPETLRKTLLSIAETILAQFNAERDHVFSETFLQLEAERLSKLVFAWLIEVEMLRPQGFQVSACEQEHNIAIEGIRIKLIIDRVDTLDDGRLLVVDYKTGRQLDYRNWAEAQITEPQLPIYAAFILQNNDIGAVCYAKVRLADHAFIGVAATESLVQGATVFDDNRGRKIFDETRFPDWVSVIKHWQTQITATARSLKSGDAAVKFNDENQLTFCDVTPLLRLPERQLQFEQQQERQS